MAAKRQLVGHIVHELLLQHPTASSLMLARVLKREQPLLFSTVEHARSLVRYYRGATGTDAKQRVISGGGLVPRTEMPAATPSEFKPFALPDARRWLILADPHIPYHVPNVLEKALALAARRETRCDAVLILGDLLDCHQLSFWEHDPTQRDISGEIDAASDFLDLVKQRLKPKHLIWKGGNHEERLQHYVIQHARELYAEIQDVATFRFLLNLDERKIVWVEPWNLIYCGALTLAHGHEWQGGMSTPVNAARTAFLRAHECCLVGHQHQVSEHTETTIRDTLLSTWSVGCACDLHPRYRRLNPRWNWGFATLDGGERWKIHNYRIVKGDVA